MRCKRRAPSRPHRYEWVWVLLAVCLLVPRTVAAQDLTWALVGTVKDEQDAVVVGALVRVTSAALIGGPVTHERQGATAPSAAAPRILRARYRVEGIRAPSFVAPHVKNDLFSRGWLWLLKTRSDVLDDEAR
jgi:hypothetical protein